MISYNSWTLIFDQNFENKSSTSLQEVVDWFWDIVSHMKLEKQQKLLLFWTAFPRVPYGGFSSFHKPLSVEVLEEEGDTYLPHAHTCFRILKLAPYSSREMLKKRLGISVEYAHIGHALA